ncbi:hypothetical protein EDC04DRAFT_2167622 [Pisolithus marmoratus]|nr:hypothetical protein EDC04DRAFT_2167622 [Pisolithus marmoratus]
MLAVSTLAALDSDLVSGIQSITPCSPQQKIWNWSSTGEKGWTSIAGWGCMLPAGQTLLANSLLHLYLGRGVHHKQFAPQILQLTCRL